MRISSVKFTNFKALSRFSVSLQSMNVLVGPNNCGKSTVLSAFRMLEQAMRTARSRRATLVDAHTGNQTYGHVIPESRIPIPIENVHSDLFDADSHIDFRFSNGSHIHLFFPADGGAIIYWETSGRRALTAYAFRRAFPIEVSVIPVLGPVEPDENIVTRETVRRAAGTHRASRHFRNYWWMNPEGFNDFKSLLETTWPGMSISLPETMHKMLVMYATEERMTRELYWAGLGFQVWCQLLTYISRNKNADLLVVDEPEVYLHPDVQRQLLSILREVKPDILLATHSVELIAEADPGEILLIDKTKRSAKRLVDVDGVQQALENIGSIQNITLTELARYRRILFVEGNNDYSILRRFAKVLGLTALSAGIGLTAIESGGFSSWDKIKGLAWGMKRALDSDLSICAVFDRDFRSDDEIQFLRAEMEKEGVIAHFLCRKEIENYLLCLPALSRALNGQIRRRTGETALELDSALSATLRSISDKFRADCSGQYVSCFQSFHRRSGKAAATLASQAIEVFDRKWHSMESRLEIVPGKQVLRELRGGIQDQYQVTLTNLRIIGSFREEEVPTDLVELIHEIEGFRSHANH